MGRPRSKSPSRSPRRGRRPPEGRREKEQRNGPERNGRRDHIDKDNHSDGEPEADEKTWGLGRRAKKDTGDHPLSSGDEIELIDEDTEEMQTLQSLMGIGGFTSTKLLDEAEKVDLLGSISEKRAEERKIEREKPLHLRRGTLTGGNEAPLLSSAPHRRREDRPRLLPERRDSGRPRDRSRSPRERRRSRSRSRDRRRRSRSRSRSRRRSRDRGDRRRDEKRQRRSRSRSRSRSRKGSPEKRRRRSRSPAVPDGDLGSV